ncbi:patatin-like phospholipase RssA [Thiohalomonas denitrificans]|uniref:NTE family protein n=1 Tax=Thiohalomonas denitrificans TaxID=415747 RepID=A0A1G5PQ06_9GAMM|nr:patatin-like phospholipase RssA [Thiohalomonas denitrificans]SCZ51715.1 NTE family protein [Thiohalomonas denitrificans]
MGRPRIALALGSGSARGWAHIGVIRALAEEGIEPEIVCGTSIGAMVGAGYVTDSLDRLEAWARALDWWDIVRFMDVKLAGGFIAGEALTEYFRKHIRDRDMKEAERIFATVATNLNTGREIWLQTGPILEAVRASMALPGLFNPVKVNGDFLVDGGLVNPVPVSAARALGADLIIAVNLNGDIVGKHLMHPPRLKPEKSPGESKAVWDQIVQRFNDELRSKLMGGAAPGRAPKAPGLFDVLASSINIMQDRITRSRMAGDPPDLLIEPRLAHVGLLEFDRADEVIAVGYDTVKQMRPALARFIE